MEGIIVYQTKYGATRQYADWLGEALQVPVFTTESIRPETLRTNRQVILGTSVIIGKMVIRRWMMRNLDYLRDKKLFMFVVCGTPAEDRPALEKIANDNIPAALKGRVTIVFLPGRLIHRDLSWRDRFLVNMGARLEKDPAKKAAVRRDVDGVKREHLDNLIELVRTSTSAGSFAGAV